MPRAEITTPDVLPDERVSDAALRPSRLNEFVGQAKVKESLQIAIVAEKQRGEPLDHALFFGPPGLGKTTLALLMAKEMGVDIRISSDPVLERPGDLVGLLTALKAGEILFIDEVHRLRPALEEFLYPAMEEYRVDVRIADGPHAQTIPMPIERFTLIGATTRFGLLTPPMRARASLVRLAGGIIVSLVLADTIDATSPNATAGMHAGDRADLRRRDRAVAGHDAAERDAAGGRAAAPDRRALGLGQGRARPRHRRRDPAGAAARG